MLFKQFRRAPVRRRVLVRRLLPGRVDGSPGGEGRELRDLGRRPLRSVRSVRSVGPLRRRQSDLEVAAARVDVARLDQVRRHAALLRRLGAGAGGHSVPVVEDDDLSYS